MILGLGTDIIEVERIRKSLERHGERLIQRLFTPEEQAYCLQHKDPAPPFAARFAAKEAVAKAFGTGFGKTISWLDIEIRKDENGKPEVGLSHKLVEQFSNPWVLISMSHCVLYATATAIWLEQNPLSPKKFLQP